jgi:hypothetical protein
MSTAISRRLAGTAAAAAALAGVMLVSPTQAYAAWGSQHPFSEMANVSNGYTNFQVGTINGWVQFDSAGHDARYSLDVCRQSAYIVHVSVAGSSPALNWGPATSPCYGGEVVVTGSVHSAGHLASVAVTLTGGTFVNGQNYVTDDDYAVLTNPY